MDMCLLRPEGCLKQWMVLDMQASVSSGLYKRMWYRTELGVGQGLRADVSHTWNGFENSA